MADVRSVFRGLWVLAIISVVVLVAASRRADRGRTWRAVRGGAIGLSIGVVDRRRRRVLRLRPALRAVPHDLLPGRLVSVRPDHGPARPALPVHVLVRDRDGRRGRDHRRRGRGGVRGGTASRRAQRRRARRRNWRRCRSPARERAAGRGAAQRRSRPRRGPRRHRPGRHGTDHRLPMPSGGSPPRPSSGASRSRRGRTRRWTATRSAPPIPPPRRRTDPVELRVIGDIAAGAAPDVTVEPGTAARIATGARLPDGADAVVPVERPRRSTRPAAQAHGAATRPDPFRRACLVHEPVPPGGSVRAEGSDLKAGATLLRAGTAITAAAVTLLAGAGVERLLVHRLPRIAVLATGDEVRAPGQPLGPAGIPDANGPGLRALVTAAGGEALDLGIATRRPRRRPDPAPLGPRRRRRRPHRLGRRLGRPVRRRQDRHRDHRPHRPLAGRRPARQAVRVRDRRSPGRWRPGPPVRPPRQPGLVRRHLRALRPPRHPRARGPARPAPAGRSRRPGRTGLQEPRPPRIHPRRSRPRRDRRPDPRRSWPRPRPPRGRAGESRHLGPRRRRRPGGHPRSRRLAPRRRRGRAVVARPGMMVATSLATTATRART